MRPNDPVLCFTVRIQIYRPLKQCFVRGDTLNVLSKQNCNANLLSVFKSCCLLLHVAERQLLVLPAVFYILCAAECEI